MTAILFVLLATIAVGGLAYGVLQPRMQLERNTRDRRQQYGVSEGEAANRKVARERLQEVAKRRKTIQSSLKDVEDRAKARDKSIRKMTLERRIAQAGLTLSLRMFAVLSILSGVLAGFGALVAGAHVAVVLGLALIAGLGLPRWVLAFRLKKRRARFMDEFANAIDLIVRGIKSGLPLGDTLRMVAKDAPEPVRSEFARVVEAQQMGLPISEAVERLYTNMPLPETNFFAIVIAIQSQAGGNLAEALANLSRVLRDRKKMKGKIQAMSMEAKASGGIIGSLPIIVAALVYVTSPDYISVLFSTTIGHLVLGASAFWMATGIVVMRNMINFDF